MNTCIYKITLSDCFIGLLPKSNCLLIQSTQGCHSINPGFIRVREMSGKFKFFQGQGIVREFYVVSGKNECLLKCQGNVREFYNLQLVSNDEKQKKKV